IQMRFQQRQQQERDQRKVEMISTTKTTAAATATPAPAPMVTSRLGAGKVRQMFDERRHRVAGIDKSYPLQPIQQQTQQQTGRTATNNGGSNVSNGNSAKTAAAGLNNKTHTISFDDDLTLTPTPAVRKLPNVGKLNVQQQNVNSLKLKPVPGRTPTTPASSTVKTASSATKPVTKRATPMASSSSAPAAPAQSSSSPSSAKVNEPVPDGLVRCTICSRNFAEDRIEKHREICQKTKSKKRKVFDTTKHRVLGTDAEKYVLQKKKVGAAASKKSVSGPSTAPKGADNRRKSDWRRKHEEFIQAIRAAKEMQAHLAKGGKLSDLPPPPPSENPDYVQCPHCSRRFNQTAAERHIPKCATMLHNKPKPTAKAKRF
ncbi:AAEL002543-PA, partial [Aedes aegypti]